ncbi:uncharacterized protein FOMMEDRAFT_157323 [Fomitiporia mediterranea MF3/22]|uniref:uncharacterized protein n=1 Tax=Fomitiporia mediterranea (strain MF3/22) TaxID=694068 RepID=UPI000440771A|nr:uncharacterized protein FOMMEDRAFT_157323 [Fomitiporia mediterranea MF3/22]EJD02131.1 hypothetical protein FOMMEDRAFT_157323 [Fomitiporia mediterranea MF3/22]
MTHLVRRALVLLTALQIQPFCSDAGIGVSGTGAPDSALVFIFSMGGVSRDPVNSGPYQLKIYPVVLAKPKKALILRPPKFTTPRLAAPSSLLLVFIKDFSAFRLSVLDTLGCASFGVWDVGLPCSALYSNIQWALEKSGVWFSYLRRKFEMEEHVQWIEDNIKEFSCHSSPTGYLFCASGVTRETYSLHAIVICTISSPSEVFALVKYHWYFRYDYLPLSVKLKNRDRKDCKSFQNWVPYAIAIGAYLDDNRRDEIELVTEDEDRLRKRPKKLDMDMLSQLILPRSSRRRLVFHNSLPSNSATSPCLPLKQYQDKVTPSEALVCDVDGVRAPTACASASLAQAADQICVSVSISLAEMRQSLVLKVCRLAARDHAPVPPDQVERFRTPRAQTISLLYPSL